MTTEIKCKKCESPQTIVQKRGFSVSKAIYGFFVMAFILAFLWAAAIMKQNTDNEIDASIESKYHVNETLNEINGTPIPQPTDYASNKILWLGTSILLCMGLINGAVGANKNKIVCLSCGETKII